MTNTDRKIEKRAARFAAFFMRFNPGYRIRVSSMRKLVRGLIREYDKHPVFKLHHRINRGNTHYSNFKCVRKIRKERSKK